MTKGHWPQVHTLGMLYWRPRLASTGRVCTIEQAQGEPKAVDMAHRFSTMLTPVATKSRRPWRFALLNAMHISSSVLRRGSEQDSRSSSESVDYGCKTQGKLLR